MTISTLFSRAVAICVLMAAVALPSQAVTTTPLRHPLFTNNRVLQRDASDSVWGWATPGTTMIHGASLSPSRPAARR